MCDVGNWIFSKNLDELFGNFLGIFLEDFFGGFFWRNFLGRFFGGFFLERIFLGEFFGGILCLHWN